MKHQKVSVDVWSMLKTMLGYLVVVVLGGILLRLMVAVFMMPRRFARERENVDKAIKDLQARYPEWFKEAQDQVDKEKEENELKEGKKEDKFKLNEENTAQLMKGDVDKKTD